MNDQEKTELRSMMVEVFHEGFEQLIEPRFDALEKGQEALLERVGGLEEGQGRLENGVDTLNTKFDQQQCMLNNLDRRVDTLEKPAQLSHA